MLVEKISQRLEDNCTDQDIVSPHRDNKIRLVDWEQFLDDINKVNFIDSRRELLEQPFERRVTVHKDQPYPDHGLNDVHRTYIIEDTILQKALRRSPPENVLKMLAINSPTYRISKELYDIIDGMSIEDDDWYDVKRYLYRLCIAKVYGLTNQQIQNVFRIRHGWREDTLLMLAARRDPPLKVVKIMVEMCRESIAIVDTPLYDWIPFIYAIAYGAKYDVVNILIPTKQDFDRINSLREFNFLENVDVYNRTPLHWTIFYGASFETVRAVKEHTADQALDVRDDLNKRPFELAISEGASIKIVEKLLPPSIPDFMTVEMNIVRSLIYKDMKRKRDSNVPMQLDKFVDNEQNLEQNLVLEDEDEFADMKMYDVSAKIVPYLAKEIPKKMHLQKLMTEKGCHTIPTAVLMLDFYSCVLLIISFRLSTTYYLNGNTNEATPWLYVLFLTVLYMVFRELFQMFSGGMGWFLDMWNYLDTASIFFPTWCMVKMYTDDVDSTFSVAAVLGTAMVWFNALAFLRTTFLHFSIFVSGLVTIITDLIPFLTVSVVLLIAFGEMYRVENLGNGSCSLPQEEGSLSFCSSGRALFSTYAMFVAGIEMQDFSSTSTMMLVSIFFGFFVAVILLNVVIAIVSTSWENVAEKGKEVFWEYRLVFYQDVKKYEELMPWHDGGEIRWVQKFNTLTDHCLDVVCKTLWIRPDYW